MRVIHSERTAVLKPSTPVPGKPGAGLAAIGGAKRLGSDINEKPHVWKLVTGDDFLKVFDLPADRAIVANSEDEIEHELDLRYPPPRAGTRCFVRAGSIPLSVKRWNNEDDHSRGSYQTIAHVVGWVVLDRPLVDQVEHIADVMSASVELGPVYLDTTDFKKVFGDIPSWKSPDRLKQLAARHDFTATYRDLHGITLIQVNYHPRAISRQEYNSELREVKKRLLSHFPSAVLHSFYALLTPDRWPSRHPFHGVACGSPLSEKRGWSNIHYFVFDASDIRKVVALSRRLGGLRLKNDRGERERKIWWRDEYHRGSGSHYCTVKETVEHALPNLHGVEQYHRKALTKELADFKFRYRSYQAAQATIMRAQYAVEGSWADDGGRPEGPPIARPTVEHGEDVDYVSPILPEEPLPDWPGFLKSHYEKKVTELGEEYRNNLWLCRWIRTEAKVAKLEIPDPPKLPKPPLKVKSKKKRRRKRNGHRKTKGQKARQLLDRVQGEDVQGPGAAQ